MKFDPHVTCMGKFMFVYITLPSNVMFHQYPHVSTKKSVNYNQTCNYLCAVFPEAIPANITEKVRGLHVITDFRPPKKNNYANEDGTPSDVSPSYFLLPSCPKSLLTWNCLGRQSRSASAFQQGALYTVRSLTLYTSVECSIGYFF